MQGSSNNLQKKVKPCDDSYNTSKRIDHYANEEYNLREKNDNTIINLDGEQYSSHKRNSSLSASSFSRSSHVNDSKNDLHKVLDFGNKHFNNSIDADELYARKLQQQEYDSVKSELWSFN